MVVSGRRRGRAGARVSEPPLAELVDASVVCGGLEGEIQLAPRDELLFEEHLAQRGVCPGALPGKRFAQLDVGDQALTNQHLAETSF